jgi:hypothetical protein
LPAAVRLAQLPQSARQLVAFIGLIIGSSFRVVVSAHTVPERTPPKQTGFAGRPGTRPRLDPGWTAAGPRLDCGWNPAGLRLDCAWTAPGLRVDPRRL